MKKKLAVRGRTILITGGGNGIGRLMALECARRGAKKVIIWDRDADRAYSVRAELHALGTDSHSATVDVTNEADVQKAATKTPDVDILINNAGVVSGATFLETPLSAVEKTFSVNTLALFIVTKAFLPGMIARNSGAVVTIASAAGLVGVARQTDYSSSKWAAIGFAESLRAELRSTGSNVNSLVVCPYFIDTGMFDGVATKYPSILPILQPDVVAEKVITAVEKGKLQLIMPRFVRIVPSGRILPPRIFDWITDTLGINASMDHFTGRAQDRVDTTSDQSIKSPIDHKGSRS